MKKHPFALATLASAISLAAFPATGAAAITLAQYNFGTNVSSSDGETGSTASSITSGGGLGTSGTTWGRSSTADDFFIRASGTADDPGPGNLNYATFTLAISPGTTYDLSSLTFTYRIQIASGATIAGNTFTSNIVVTSSLNGHATPLGQYQLSRNTGVGITETDPSPSIDLSAYTNVSGNVEFRFYVTDNTNFANDVARLDNIVLTAVPEAASSTLIAAGMASGLLRRRRGR